MSFKRLKIIKKLNKYGFYKTREGINHTVFSNGKVLIPVPRHNEITKKTAMKIAKEIGVRWDIFRTNL